MAVGIGRVALRFPHSRSLKDKRNTMKSITSHVKRNYNLSVIEAEGQNTCNFSVLEMAGAVSSKDLAHQLIRNAINYIEDNFDCQVIGNEIEVWEA